MQLERPVLTCRICKKSDGHIVYYIGGLCHYGGICYQEMIHRDIHAKKQLSFFDEDAWKCIWCCNSLRQKNPMLFEKLGRTYSNLGLEPKGK